MPSRRGLQKRAADALKPLGFNAISGTTFTRQVGEQLQFIGLQYGGSSKGFTFNLGCHFTDIPSTRDFRAVSVDDLEDLDCGLRIRVGRYIGEGLDTWWTADNSELPAAIAQASWAIERAFADCIKRWGNDGTTILRSHVKSRAGTIRLSKALFQWMLPKGDFERFAFVALLAHRHGDEVLSRMAYEKALSCKASLIPSHIPKLSASLDMSEVKPNS